MTAPRMDNGEWMMRRPDAIIPTWGEKPEPEDTTGLKMLDEFLAKRKGERDGNERK